MTIKSISSELIKVANNLDVSGFISEADSIDKVIEKLAAYSDKPDGSSVLKAEDIVGWDRDTSMLWYDWYDKRSKEILSQLQALQTSSPVSGKAAIKRVNEINSLRDYWKLHEFNKKTIESHIRSIVDYERKADSDNSFKKFLGSKEQAKKSLVIFTKVFDDLYALCPESAGFIYDYIKENKDIVDGDPHTTEYALSRTAAMFAFAKDLKNRPDKLKQFASLINNDSLNLDRVMLSVYSKGLDAIDYVADLYNEEYGHNNADTSHTWAD